MSLQCPEYVNPERVADREGNCSGSRQLVQFERLQSLLVKHDGVAEYSFYFSRDMHHRPLIRGRVEAILWLQCQRCMDEYPLDVKADFSLVQVAGADEAALLPAEHDALMATEEGVSLAELVEDELILAIPAVPKHESCQAAVTESGETNRESARENPFEALASLKKDND